MYKKPWTSTTYEKHQHFQRSPSTSDGAISPRESFLLKHGSVNSTGYVTEDRHNRLKSQGPVRRPTNNYGRYVKPFHRRTPYSRNIDRGLRYSSGDESEGPLPQNHPYPKHYKDMSFQNNKYKFISKDYAKQNGITIYKNNSDVQRPRRRSHSPIHQNGEHTHRPFNNDHHTEHHSNGYHVRKYDTVRKTYDKELRYHNEDDNDDYDDGYRTPHNRTFRSDDDRSERSERFRSRSRSEEKSKNTSSLSDISTRDARHLQNMTGSFRKNNYFTSSMDSEEISKNKVNMQNGSGSMKNVFDYSNHLSSPLGNKEALGNARKLQSGSESLNDSFEHSDALSPTSIKEMHEPISSPEFVEDIWDDVENSSPDHKETEIGCLHNEDIPVMPNTFDDKIEENKMERLLERRVMIVLEDIAPLLNKNKSLNGARWIFRLDKFPQLRKLCKGNTRRTIRSGCGIKSRKNGNQENMKIDFVAHRRSLVNHVADSKKLDISHGYVMRTSLSESAHSNFSQENLTETAVKSTMKTNISSNQSQEGKKEVFQTFQRDVTNMSTVAKLFIMKLPQHEDDIKKAFKEIALDLKQAVLSGVE